MESVQRTEPENVLRQFKEETVSSIDHKEMTRHQVMLLLARKHDILASALEDEKNVLDALVKKYRPLLDRALSERDRCNALVRELKEKRRQLYVEIRVLREQFFSLLEKAEELEGAADRARKLKKEVENLDRRIETDAITLLQERDFIDQIRQKMEIASRENVEYQKKEGVEKRVKDLALTIGQRFGEAEAVHKEFLNNVEKSDVAHADVKRLEPFIGPASRRSDWLSNRIQLHRESKEYWEERCRREVEALDDKKGKKPSQDGGSDKKGGVGPGQ